MRNKQSLLDLVARAERGALLPGEAQILRDFIEHLDEMAMTLDKISDGLVDLAGSYDYKPSDTQSFKAIVPSAYRTGCACGYCDRRPHDDDDAPGRP